MDQLNTYEHTSNEILQFVISQLCEMTEAYDIAQFTFLPSQLRLMLQLPIGRRFDIDTMIYIHVV